MILPGVIAVAMPPLVGFTLGAMALGGMLAGGLLGCVALGIIYGKCRRCLGQCKEIC